MNTGAEEQLAVSSGVALRKVGGRLYFVDLGISWVPTTGFVFGLLALIFTLNGLLQLALSFTGQGILLIAAILTPLGLLLGALSWKVFKIGRARTHAPMEGLKTVAIVDLNQGWLLDGRAQAVAYLNQVTFTTRFQWNSSSRRLVARWPGGELSLVQGNPFGGGLFAITHALAQQRLNVA